MKSDYLHVGRGSERVRYAEAMAFTIPGGIRPAQGAHRDMREPGCFFALQRCSS